MWINSKFVVIEQKKYVRQHLKTHEKLNGT